MMRKPLLIFVFVSFMAGVQSAKAEQLIVYVAASMKEAVEDISTAYKKNCDCKIVLSVGGTGTLARQIAHGAPADIFISADKKWMDYLSQHNALIEDSIEVIAVNQLVIVTQKLLTSMQPPLNIMDKVRFAMGNPQSVPAGRYAKEALESLGKWQAFKSNAVLTENVRVALAMVARGDLAVAIVYESDLTVDPRVKVAHRFKPETHSEIQYLAAETKYAQPKAGTFLNFLKSKQAQSILQKFGFSAVTGN